MTWFRHIRPMELGTEQHYNWMFGIVASIVIMNLLDATLTVFWLSSGAATEANPLMETLFDIGSVPFVLGKMFLVSAGIHLLWLHRDRALAVIGVFGIFMLYYLTLLYHLQVVSLATFEILL